MALFFNCPPNNGYITEGVGYNTGNTVFYIKEHPKYGEDLVVIQSVL